MGGFTQSRNVNAPGGLPNSVICPRENTPRALCRQIGLYKHVRGGCAPKLCRCGRRTWSEIIFLTLGPWLLTQCAVPARAKFFTCTRILDLPQWLKRSGDTGGATLNTCSCYLNARISRVWETYWRLHFSGMTSCGHVLNPILPRGYCLRCFRPVVPPLRLPRIVLSRSSSTLLPPWAVTPLAA